MLSPTLKFIKLAISCGCKPSRLSDDSGEIKKA